MGEGSLPQPRRLALAGTRNYKCAIRPLRRLYGRTPATEFGPKKLKALQGEMVRLGWTRKYLNRHVRRIQAIFRWAVSEELLPPSVSQALDTVAGLKRGKGGAAEAPPVKPVEEETVNQTLPHLPEAVAAMVRLQLLTGMRSGETCIMRTGDIDRSKTVWVYRPAKQKTEHHGHPREIRIGPKAQTVLTPWLKLDPAAYLFSPAESEADRHEQMREARATPVTKSQQARARLAKRRRRSRAPKDRYTPHSYAKAIGRGCEAAFPAPEHLARRRVAGNGRKAKSERWETRREWYARLGEEGLKELRAWRRAHNWHPHQLRHTAGTVIRREGGVDVAGAFLGHSSLNTTQIYAEQDAKRVEEIVARVG